MLKTLSLSPRREELHPNAVTISGRVTHVYRQDEDVVVRMCSTTGGQKHYVSLLLPDGQLVSLIGGTRLQARGYLHSVERMETVADLLRRIGHPNRIEAGDEAITIVQPQPPPGRPHHRRAARRRATHPARPGMGSGQCAQPRPAERMPYDTCTPPGTAAALQRRGKCAAHRTPCPAHGAGGAQARCGVGEPPTEGIVVLENPPEREEPAIALIMEPHVCWQDLIPPDFAPHTQHEVQKREPIPSACPVCGSAVQPDHRWTTPRRAGWRCDTHGLAHFLEEAYLPAFKAVHAPDAWMIPPSKDGTYPGVRRRDLVTGPIGYWPETNA